MENKRKLMFEMIQESYERRKKQIDDRLHELQLQQKEDEEQLMNVSQTLYGTPFIDKPRGILATIRLIIVLAIVAISEWPLNAAAFEIFERPQMETYAMSIGFGLLIAIFAHFSGYSLKRFVANKKSYFIIIGMFLLIAAIVALYITSSLRFNYLTEMGGKPLAIWIFTVFSSIIFFVGVAASFFHISSVQNLQTEKSYKSKYKMYSKRGEKVKDLEKQLDRLYKEYQLNLSDEGMIAGEKKRRDFMAEEIAKKADPNYAAAEKEALYQAEVKAKNEAEEKEIMFKSQSSSFESNLICFNEFFEKTCQIQDKGEKAQRLNQLADTMVPSLSNIIYGPSGMIVNYPENEEGGKLINYAKKELRRLQNEIKNEIQKMKEVSDEKIN